jgi:hypothetical protein
MRELDRSGGEGGRAVGQSAAQLADAVLAIIERGGRHAWVEVVELCARARREGAVSAAGPANELARRRRNVP